MKFPKIVGLMFLFCLKWPFWIREFRGVQVKKGHPVVWYSCWRAQGLSQVKVQCVITGKIWSSYKVLGSVKYFWNIDISHLEPKLKIKCLFCNFFSDKTFHPETASKNITYRSFHPGWALTAIELDFFCFAVKPVNLWIYFQNFFKFVCVLTNARKWPSTIFFTTFTCRTFLKRHFS